MFNEVLKEISGIFTETPEQNSKVFLKQATKKFLEMAVMNNPDDILKKYWNKFQRISRKTTDDFRKNIL